MAGGGSAAEAGEPEFQIAPIVDVLLVLLIFFMSIMTAQVEQIDKNVKLPTAADAREKRPEKNQRTVNLRWIQEPGAEGRALLTFGGQEWEDRDKLAEELKAIAEKMDDGKGGTKLEVVLRADKNAPAKEVSAAMQVVGQATAAIAFATYNRQ